VPLYLLPRKITKKYLLLSEIKEEIVWEPPNQSYLTSTFPILAKLKCNPLRQGSVSSNKMI
jgi:hypothetical protein